MRVRDLERAGLVPGGGHVLTDRPRPAVGTDQHVIRVEPVRARREHDAADEHLDDALSDAGERDLLQPRAARAGLVVVAAPSGVAPHDVPAAQELLAERAAPASAVLTRAYDALAPAGERAAGQFVQHFARHAHAARQARARADVREARYDVLAAAPVRTGPDVAAR